MNLVMFGYFAGSQQFGDLTDIDLKTMLFEQKVKDIDDDLPPFGFIEDGLDDQQFEEGKPWAIEYAPDI